MLRIRNLSASIDGTEILRGLNLDVSAGEVHAIMGPNGSGKSTFAQVIAGREVYKVSADELSFEGRNLLSMPAELRARNGLFLAFQYPVEIPGVSNLYFLRSAVNAIRAHRGLPELDAMDFMSVARDRAQKLGLDDTLLRRSLNEGFSGGEKKRNEILQMMLLEPRLAILDESDSGLDIDALKVVADGINAMRHPERGIVLVTHYQRLLNYVVPDRVHVLIGGRIVRSGGKELALELEERGYAAGGFEA
jgi:Fe-S cluster assembly ATP-binding protein